MLDELLHLTRPSDDGDVAALTLDVALSDGDEVLAVGDFTLCGVEGLVLKEDDRIGVADGRLEEPLGICGRRRRKADEARDVGILRLEALAVLGGECAASAGGTAQDDGAGELSRGHLVGLGGRVDDGVEREDGEVVGHHLDDGAETGEGGADGDGHEAELCDGGVDDPLFAEAGEHALRDLVGAIILGDLFAEEIDAGVAFHLFRHGLVECVTEEELRHVGARQERA